MNRSIRISKKPNNTQARAVVTSGEEERGRTRQGIMSKGTGIDNVILGRLEASLMFDLLQYMIYIYIPICVTVHKKF